MAKVRCGEETRIAWQSRGGRQRWRRQTSCDSNTKRCTGDASGAAHVEVWRRYLRAVCLVRAMVDDDWCGVLMEMWLRLQVELVWWMREGGGRAGEVNK